MQLCKNVKWNEKKKIMQYLILAKAHTNTCKSMPLKFIYLYYKFVKKQQ